MKTTLIAVLSGVGLSASLAFADSPFKETSKYLDLDGNFVAFADFEGDGQEIGQALSEIYQNASSVVPDIPPMPIDFSALFEVLGFGSLKSFGMSSKELDDGLVRNRSVAVLNGDPVGLMGLYGLEPIPFRAAEYAPADSTTAVSGEIDFLELKKTILGLAEQLAGPMGTGMVQQGLVTPVPNTDVTAEEIIAALSNGFDFVMYQKMDNPQQPDTQGFVEFAGAADLVKRLMPMLESMEIQFVETDEGELADLSRLVNDMPFGLYVRLPKGSDSVQVYTDADWVSGFGDANNLLKDTAAFRRVVDPLPSKAAMFSYSAGFDLDPIYQMLESNPEVGPYLPIMRQVVDLMIGDFLKPNASAAYRDGDAIVSDQYAEFSIKQALGTLPAVVGIAAAVPSYIQYQKSMEQAAAQAEEAAWAEEAESLEE